MSQEQIYSREIIENFRIFGLSVFVVFILNLIRIIIGFSVSLIISTDIIYFYFRMGIFIIIFFSCTRLYNNYLQLNENKNLLSFIIIFPLGHSLVLIYDLLNFFIFSHFTTDPIYSIFLTLSVIFPLIEIFLYYFCYDSLKKFLENNKSKFSVKIKNDARTGLLLLVIANIMYLLFFLIITMFIGLILEVISYFKLSSFRLMSYENELKRLQKENEARMEVKRKITQLKNQIISLNNEYDEITIDELNNLIDIDDRVFLRMKVKPLKEFLLDMILNGELNAKYDKKEDKIVFSR